MEPDIREKIVEIGRELKEHENVAEVSISVQLDDGSEAKYYSNMDNKQK